MGIRHPQGLSSLTVYEFPRFISREEQTQKVFIEYFYKSTKKIRITPPAEQFSSYCNCKDIKIMRERLYNFVVFYCLSTLRESTP